MRVLWFINVPTKEAAEYLGYQSLNIGGWFDSLKDELVKNPDIQLGIAFSYADMRTESFTINKIKYYKLPYLRPTKGIKAIIANLMHQLESLEIIDYCLKTVEDYKPDIINIFGTERNFGLICSQTKIPCVIHIQGILNEIINKYFSGISKSDIIFKGYFRRLLSGNSLLHYYFKLKKQSKRELEIFNTCNNFLGRTNWDKGLAKQLSPNSNYYHSDEIIREEFYNASWEPSENNVKIIYSTLGAQNYKGLELLAQTSLIINKENKIDATFNIGGLTESDEVFRIVIKKHGSEVNKYLKPSGRLSPSEIIKEMLKSDVYVHPSHIDNSPNSLCEAMLVGMPIVSTDVGGIPSLIENEVDGLLVPSGNANLMTQAILRIINDKVLAIKLSKNGIERANERHNKDKILKQIFEIYKDSINYA